MNKIIYKIKHKALYIEKYTFPFLQFKCSHIRLFIEQIIGKHV